MAGTLEWQFGQVFGERSPGEDIQDADIISAVEFDAAGEFLATGDHGGRVVPFARVGGPPPPRRAESPLDARPPARPAFGYEYRYLTEFQSHEPEFDYLKSLEIEEKINCVRWVRRDSPALAAPSAHLLLTTNDKTIKLWKVYEKEVLTHGGSGGGGRRLGRADLDENRDPGLAGKDRTSHALNGNLVVPRVERRETLWTSRRRRMFASAHAYHINTVSVCSDKETFLSADDLRINLWNLDAGPQAFTVVDIKPSSMEDLTEVITRAAFHPTDAHCLAYSTSRGAIRLADLRVTALADKAARQFEAAGAGGAEGGGPKNFFSEIISSISDFSFFGDGHRRIVARDYMTVKVWDVAMEREPLEVHNVHEPLRSRVRRGCVRVFRVGDLTHYQLGCITWGGVD